MHSVKRTVILILALVCPTISAHRQIVDLSVQLTLIVPATRHALMRNVEIPVQDHADFLLGVLSLIILRFARVSKAILVIRSQIVYQIHPHVRFPLRYRT